MSSFFLDFTGSLPCSLSSYLGEENKTFHYIALHSRPARKVRLVVIERHQNEHVRKLKT